MGKKLTTQDAIERAQRIHGMFYDYSDFEFINWETRTKICCPHHGTFLQKPKQHILRKGGCPECGKIKAASQKNTITREQFIERATEIHGGKYDYTTLEYTGYKKPVSLVCKKHGMFEFKHAYTHILNKNGCPKCAKEQNRLTTEEFIKKAKRIHGDYYVYSKTNYTTSERSLTIECPEHGEQHITPLDHYRVGCWVCKRNRMQDIWLDEIGVPNTKENRQVRIFIDERLYVVDGYISETNAVFLFHGDYWHGNPVLYKAEDINKRNGKPFGELFKNTLIYENALIKAGYNVNSIWEYEWLQQTKNVHSVKEN